MDLEEIRSHCLSKRGTITEDCPFGEDVLVFRVFGKIFLLTVLDDIPLKVNLKCDPVRAVDLRERYEAIVPGYHMNKRRWNTVTVGMLPDRLVMELIDHSYDETVKTLPQKVQKKISGEPVAEKVKRRKA